MVEIAGDISQHESEHLCNFRQKFFATFLLSQGMKA
jgi:hypothetical protein